MVTDNQNLLASFTSAAATSATVDYFEIVGTFTLQPAGDCPTSFRAYQTIELAPSISCFAAPVEVTFSGNTGPTNVVETVTYIYKDCPVVQTTSSFGPVITVVHSIISQLELNLF